MLNPLPMSTPAPAQSTTVSTPKGTHWTISNHVDKTKIVVQQPHAGAPVGHSVLDQARPSSHHKCGPNFLELNVCYCACI